MRREYAISLLTAGMLIIGVGCQSGGRGDRITGDSGRASKPAKGSGDSASGPYARGFVSGPNNPTTQDERGEPSLDDTGRPAAWIYVDGRKGRYAEQDGHTLMEWIIDRPVSRTPTFRAAVYEPLLGAPRDFKCVLQTIRAEDGSHVSYGIAAKDGTFQVGKEYPLLNPGGNFTIRVRSILGTNEVVSVIEPLSPGRYALVAGLKNAESGVEAPAVTYFTVRKTDQ